MAEPLITFEVRPADRPRSPAERERIMKDPGFGQVFSDHMVSMTWAEHLGWSDARIGPYVPLVLDPATSVFHYGQEVFEGLKAFRHPDGSIMAWRPYAHAARFNRSARRVALPTLPEEVFVRSLELLIGLDRDYVPTRPGHSLYMRPFMIATGRGFGLDRPSGTYLYVVIASPVGAYVTRPLSAWLSRTYVRAVPGGTGEAKFGGNYAGGFPAQRQAAEHGCDQVVWLDAVERRWVEEMGAMNVFFVYGSASRARLVTPPLSGSLLPGITRECLLTLAADLGIRAEERPVSIEQWRAGCVSGEITEVFGCGTAAVVAPVVRVRSEEADWTIADGLPGPLTMRLRRELVAIQYGTSPDTHGWTHRISQGSASGRWLRRRRPG